MVINHFKENILCTIKIAQTIKKSFKHADHKVYYLKQILAKYCECGYKRIIRLLVLLLCNPCIHVFNARVVEYCLNYNNYITLALEILQSKRLQTFLCGDYNIDLLKIFQKNQYNIFFENLITAGFQPKISLPTRLTDHSATLIDNIFCNRIDNNESGIIINHISDHQMVYTYSTEKVYATRVRQYVELETNDSQAMNTFLEKLHDSNIADKLNRDLNSDPNDNLRQLLDIFSHLKNVYLPKRRVRLNKRNIKYSLG